MRDDEEGNVPLLFFVRYNSNDSSDILNRDEERRRLLLLLLSSFDFFDFNNFSFLVSSFSSVNSRLTIGFIGGLICFCWPDLSSFSSSFWRFDSGSGNGCNDFLLLIYSCDFGSLVAVSLSLCFFFVYIKFK